MRRMAMFGAWEVLMVLVFLSLCAQVSVGSPAHGSDPMQGAANVVSEWTFTAAKEHADAFNNVELDAVFTDPKGAAHRVPAFWAGGKTWKVRYASPLVGRHTFRTECSDRTDGGLHGI